MVVSADVPHNQLFQAGKDDNDDDIDEQRKLMDDLGIEMNSSEAKTSIFTGEEELFAFDRTISRLSEMQSKEYWDAWDKQRR